MKQIAVRRLLKHSVRNIRRERGVYVIDDAFECRYLIGAGGTRCPVYRTLFRAANPRASGLQTVTLEHEIPYDWQDPDCHLWFFEKKLPGYAWYVPKANGWLNVGIGGMADRMKKSGHDIKYSLARSFTRAQLDRKLAPRAAVRSDRATAITCAAGLRWRASRMHF